MNSSSYRRSIVALTIALSPCVALDAVAAPPYEDELTPGELRGVAMTFGDPWRLGYWEYLPANYDELAPGELLPLLVFLPGIGEYDDVSSCPGGTDVCSADACGGDGLCRNLSWGPQQHMRVGNWDDTLRPFIMVSPQNDVAPFTTNEWEISELETFFAYIVENYPVDPRRMYITGMSQGGRGVLQYLNENPRQFAGAAPMPAGTVFPTDVGCNLQDTGLWMFHGEDDNNANLGAGVFSPCSMVGVEHMYNHPDLYPGSPSCVARVSEPGHPAGRMTMFYDVGHFAWVEAIDPVGEGFPASEWASDQGCGIAADFHDYSAASETDGVYTWFAALDRPDVTVPDDFEVSGDDPSTTITATVVDDDAITWTWTQTAGPAATLVDADTETLQVDGLTPLSQYTFEVLALDADGQWDRDEITVDVSAATVGGSSSSDGGVITTDPGSSGVITDTISGGVTDTDSTTGDVSVTDTDASTGSITSVTDTDASTGNITSVTDTDATTGNITSVSDTDATTGNITSVSDTDATTGNITSDTETEVTTLVTGEVSSGETGSGSTDITAGTSSSEDSGSATTATTTLTTTTDDSESGASADDTSSTGGSADSGSASLSSTTLPGGDDNTQDTNPNGDSESTGPGVIGEDAPEGCACSTDDRRPLAGAPWAMLLALVVRPRRRQRI